MARTGRAYPSRRTNYSVRPPQIAAAGMSFVTWPQTAPIKRVINPADWTGTVMASLEVHGSTSDAAKPLVCRLFNITTGSVMGGSEVDIASLTPERGESIRFALTPGNNIYRVDYGGVDFTDAHELRDAIVWIWVTPL